MGWYRSAARPLLFSFPPETAHQLAGAALRLPLPWGMLGGSSSDPSLETDLAGIHLRNPVGLAAGFDKNCRELRGLDRLGFGYLVGGTVTSAPRAGNSKPRIVRLKGRESMVNSMGLPNDGVQAVLRRLRAIRRDANSAALLVSLADEDIVDIASNCELLAPYVEGFELNISSPNSPFRHGRDDEQNLDHLGAALAAIADLNNRRVFVKLPPFRTASERDVVMALAEAAAKGGADGLTCSNTAPVDEARLAAGRGGLSGRDLFSETPKIVEHVRRATGLPINACGGIFSADDARSCLDAGATTVQLYTGLIFEGPRVVRRLTEGLASPVAASRGRVQDG